MTLLATIQKYGPLTTAELWDDIETMRKASPCEDLPKTLGELGREVLALHVGGKIEALPGDKWMPVRKAEKVVPQLF